MGALWPIGVGHSANCCLSQTYSCRSYNSWPWLLEETQRSPLHPLKISFVTHGTWLSCQYFLPKERRLPALRREAHFSWCAQGLLSRLMLLGGATSSVFPGVCEIQSVLEEHNLWLNDKYLRYLLPLWNHRAIEGLHHAAMKLVMVFKCSGLSMQPCSSLTM